VVHPVLQHIRKQIVETCGLEILIAHFDDLAKRLQRSAEMVHAEL